MDYSLKKALTKKLHIIYNSYTLGFGTVTAYNIIRYGFLLCLRYAIIP